MSVRVILRFRPPNQLEKETGSVNVIDYLPPDALKIAGTEYTFDRVFQPGDTQKQVFEHSVTGVTEDVMNGFNGTVFAYGQTGSGKTWTMMGDEKNEENKGIIPRLVENIFATITRSSDDIEFTPASNNLPIHEDPQKGPYIKGLKEVYVSNINEIFEVMHAGSQARAVTATKMNEESSRSHSIFMITVHQTNKQDQSSKSSTLYLVDLAGSEKIGKTGASGQTLEEAKKINKSLTALGMVINALTDGKSKHIPYRDSKLTRILQESLGGNSKTTLMINASPMSFNETETISTLRFGYRAKSIKNKAKANVDLSVPQLKKLLAESAARVAQLESHIGKLTSEIKIWRQGGTVAESERAGNFANTTNSTSEEVKIAPISGETTRDAELLVDFEAKEAEVDQLQQTVDELRAKMEAQQTELETWQKRCQDNEELITQMNDLNALTAAPKMDEEIRRKTSNMMAGYASTEEELSPQAVEQPEVASEQVITKPASTSEKAEGDAQAMKQLMERQVAEFDNIRKELVRDLQNRCEKVVELEIALDEASNTNGGKSLHGGTGSLKTKIQTLEYNITQLLQVHKQLILQNSNTKRDHIILDRESTAKSEKISQLERTIQGLNQRLIDSDVRHGKQVENLWAKIAAAGSATTTPAGQFSFGDGKIAKPVRGHAPAPSSSSS